MSAAPLREHEIASELAYDLMQDHMDTVLALLDRPLSREEVVRRLGSEKMLDRMVRHGLLQADGDAFRAVSSYYHQLRQEGMVSFLERYVLPSLVASVHAEHEEDFATLENLWLQLPEEAMAGLRPGPVGGLFDDLIRISDEPAQGSSSRLTVLVVGTSRLITETMNEGDRALRHTQHASVQRSLAQEKARAVLSQFDALADAHRYASSAQAIERFLATFDAQRVTGPETANYHLTVASHWRRAIAPGQATASQAC